MTPTTLNRVGTALYGQQWQCQLARAIGVNPRTLRRWLSQEMPIPDLRAELREIVRDRQQTLLETLEELS